MVINRMENGKICFGEFSVKKKRINGIIIRKVIPVSFDINERKKLMLPRQKASIDLEEKYLRRKNIEINPKRKHKISSILLILFTTSVCIG